MGIHLKYKAIVIGTSAGGLHVLLDLLPFIPAWYPIPIVVVQHRSRDQRELLEEVLQSKCDINIKQADEKEMVKGGTVYLAPPDYHLLIESDGTLSLSADEPVKYSRPSIDVLFESAAIAFKEKLVGIVLTGSNNDGAKGAVEIKKSGGVTIAQDPIEAEYTVMPRAAIETNCIDYIWTMPEIKNYLMNIIKEYHEKG